jgi:pimeloyl-ACP methyl ester carboxylesterase
VTGIPRDVLLLHGCGGSVRATFGRTGWFEAIAAQGRRALAPDLPGHGPNASHDPASYADLAGLVAKGLPEGPIDAVGFSLGAKLVLELALRHPALFRRLVLGGIGDNVFAPEVFAPAAAEALESPGSAAAAHPAVRPMLQRFEPELNDARAIAAVLRRPPNPRFTGGRIATLGIPVLIVNGAEDPVGQMGNQLVSSLRNVRIQVLPGVDHFGLPGEAAFRRLALEFLAAEEGVPT